MVSISSAVKSSLVKAFQNWTTDFDQQLRSTITTEQYWPGFGDVRDIVDSGDLRDSQNLTVSGTSAKWQWDGKGNTPASDVLLGDDEFPGRDWITETWNQEDQSKKLASFL